MIGSSPHPTFVGVGEHKCGTTWLSECLRRHPEVFMSSPKEIHYFGGSLEARGLDWYLQHFSRAGCARAVGEFSTSYLSRPTSAESILRQLGKVRILIALRHPIDRLVSDIKHEIRNGQSFGMTDGLITPETIDHIRRSNEKMLDRCNYTENVRRYLEVFHDDRVLILFQEDFLESGAPTLSSLYRFLGVDDSFTPDIVDEKISVGIVPRRPFLETWRRRIHSAVKRASPRLVYLIKRTGAPERYRRLNASPLEVRPTPDAMERLLQMFGPDMDRLRDLLDQPARWRAPPLAVLAD